MVGLFLSIISLSFFASFANPSQNANKIILQLTGVGRSLLEKNTAPENRFPFKINEKVDTRVFEQKILKQLDSDSFVDAFVRWQLCKCDISLPELSDSAFKKLLEHLPKYPENPRAGTQYCDSIARAATSGRKMSRPEMVSLKQRVDETNAKYKIVTLQIKPADQFRLWIIDELQQYPSRLALAHLERIASRVQAGWKAKKAISHAETSFIKINGNGGLPESSQTELNKIVSRISGITRLTLVHIETSYDGKITPHWQSTAVDEFVLKRLLRLLRKTTETTDGFLGRDRTPPVKSTP
jgi:hypothetical protein